MNIKTAIATAAIAGMVGLSAGCGWIGERGEMRSELATLATFAGRIDAAGMAVTEAYIDIEKVRHLHCADGAYRALLRTEHYLASMRDYADAGYAMVLAPGIPAQRHTPPNIDGFESAETKLYSALKFVRQCAGG